MDPVVDGLPAEPLYHIAIPVHLHTLTCIATESLACMDALWNTQRAHAGAKYHSDQSYCCHTVELGLQQKWLALHEVQSLLRVFSCLSQVRADRFANNDILRSSESCKMITMVTNHANGVSSGQD